MEPALLSLCYTQLNRRRPPDGVIDAALLAQAGQYILQDLYKEAMQALPDAVQRFVEDYLIQGGRARGGYARDAAIEQGFTSAEQLNTLTDVHRVLRIE